VRLADDPLVPEIARLLKSDAVKHDATAQARAPPPPYFPLPCRCVGLWLIGTLLVCGRSGPVSTRCDDTGLLGRRA